MPPHARIGSPAGLAVAVLVSVTLAFYHGLWLPGLVLAKRDAFRFFPEIKRYAAERLASGELPHWFPYDSLGHPFIGATTTGLFHPFTVLYFLLSAPDAYRISALLSCLFAALGAFALGRTVGLSHAGSLLSSIAFALSGYMVSLTDNLPYLYSTCLLPVFCATIDKALRKAYAWAAVPAVVWATVFLQGDVQTGYYYGFIALLWAAFRAPESYRQALPRLALMTGLTVLLAGIQLGPAWAVFTDTERTQPSQFHEQSLGWSTPPLRLLTVLAGPVGEHGLTTEAGADEGFYGIAQEKSLGFLYIGYFWAESLYLGIPVVGLALLGARHQRNLRVLAVLGSLALLLALGHAGGLYEVFYRVVPLWSAFRYPEKFLGIASFAVAMLAGAGLDAIRMERAPIWPWLAASLLLAGIGIGLWTDAFAAWVTTSLAAPAPLARQVAASSAQAVLFSALTALGVGAVAGAIRRRTFPTEILLGVLLTIIALDLTRANLSAYHTAPAEAATFEPPLAQALQAREGAPPLGRARLVSLVENLVAFPEELERRLGHQTAVVVAGRHALTALHNAEFKIETARPYLAGYKTELMIMLRETISTQAAARFNVAYYIGLRSRIKNAPLARDLLAALPEYDLILFRNPAPAKPRVYLSAKPERTGQPTDPAALLRRPDFLSGEVDVIETADDTLPGPARTGSAVLEQYLPEEVRVRVDSPTSAVLILLDAFDKGWTATLDDDRAVPILRANALVRAVVVPAGPHRVTFRYETRFLRIGAWASLAGVLLCTGLLVPTLWRKRHRNAHA